MASCVRAAEGRHHAHVILEDRRAGPSFVEHHLLWSFFVAEAI